MELTAPDRRTRVVPKNMIQFGLPLSSLLFFSVTRIGLLTEIGTRQRIVGPFSLTCLSAAFSQFMVLILIGIDFSKVSKRIDKKRFPAQL